MTVCVYSFYVWGVTLYILRWEGMTAEVVGGDRVDEGGAEMTMTSLPSTPNFECRPYCKFSILWSVKKWPIR